eukprot:TRINITY_DN16020_c0_g2_i1.p1 TRINITY_DN16020_c0_g2~~TRINITY_DN16020_c0_g2_i1.p1  ORF type:complete len:194 (+),score=54.46 TRINITY_DN16020_c0_g2_i1:624-1205(+)
MSAISVLKRTGAIRNQGAGVTVFDLCSGKGITAAILALSYPELQVHMVDLDGAMNLSHVAALSNCTFHYGNVFDTAVVDLMVKEAEHSELVMLGTHLCGMLSPRLIDLFNEVEQVSAMLLCPCCLKGTLGYQVKQKARAEKRDHHQVLCDTLLEMLDDKHMPSLLVDEHMKSIKNVFVHAKRGSPGAAPGETA